MTSDAVELPQLYLITPSDFELSTFTNDLVACLDTTEIACVRLSMATRDEDRLSRAADALREITHARDIALVIDDHVALVERLGLDGVHLTDGARSVGKVRKTLGEDAIVGAYCGNSRHDGMNAGELNADYVSFGPLAKTALGHAEPAELELFQWWSMMIEVPVVAEGALSLDLVRQLTPHTDFFGFSDEIWKTDNAAQTLLELRKAMEA